MSKSLHRQNFAPKRVNFNIHQIATKHCYIMFIIMITFITRGLEEPAPPPGASWLIGTQEKSANWRNGVGGLNSHVMSPIKLVRGKGKHYVTWLIQKDKYKTYK